MKVILFILGGVFISLYAAHPLDSGVGQLQWYDIVVSASRCDRIGMQNEIYCYLDTFPPDTIERTYLDAAQAKATELIDAELLETFPGEEYRTEKLLEILQSESESADLNRFQEAKRYIEELYNFTTKKEEDFTISHQIMRISYTTAESLARQKFVNRLLDMALESINVAYAEKKTTLSALNVLANMRSTG